MFTSSSAYHILLRCISAYPSKTASVNCQICFKLTDIFPLVSSQDRKSTRLNSSHLVISYAVFCLKKKNCIVIAIEYVCSLIVPGTVLVAWYSFFVVLSTLVTCILFNGYLTDVSRHIYGGSACTYT